MTEHAKTSPETATGEAPPADAPTQVRRRVALARLGLATLVAYSAPSVERLNRSAYAGYAPDCPPPTDGPIIPCPGDGAP